MLLVLEDELLDEEREGRTFVDCLRAMLLAETRRYSSRRPARTRLLKSTRDI